MSQKKLKKVRQEQSVKIFDNDTIVVYAQRLRDVLKENWKFILIVLIVISLFYANGIQALFVSDDYATIPQNEEVANFWLTFKNTPNLIHISNTVIAMLFGTANSTPFHIYSLMVYLTTCVTAFVFVYLIMGRNIAMLTLILFSLHPIHVEAVTWISGKPYLFSALFCLLSLICFKQLLETGSKKYLYTFFIMLLLTYLSEGARSLTIFLLIPLLLVYRGFKGIKIDLTKIGLFLAVICPIILIIIWPRLMARINVVNSGYNISESIFYNPFFQYPTTVTKYLQILTVPTDLTLYHTMYILPVWLNWLVLIAYLANIIYFYFKNKKIAFALVFIFLATASSMTPIKVAWLVAERYMFFGSLGFCLFLALILNNIGNKSKWLMVGLTSVIVVFYGVRVIYRNNDWNTNHNLWVNTCQVSPNSHNAWNNIGDDYDKLKQYDNAIKGFTQSTIVKPNYADAFHNRANIFYKIGRLDLARDSYNTAISFSPGLNQTYLSLVQIDLTEKKVDLALVHAKKALELQPSNPQAAYVLGVVYAEAGQIDEAKKIMTAVTQNYPGFQLANEALKKLETIKK